MDSDWTMDDIVMLYEIRGIYDGWCFAELKDGRLVNRWPEGDHRFKATEECMKKMEDYTRELEI